MKKCLYTPLAKLTYRQKAAVSISLLQQIKKSLLRKGIESIITEGSIYIQKNTNIYYDNYFRATILLNFIRKT